MVVGEEVEGTVAVDVEDLEEVVQEEVQETKGNQKLLKNLMLN